ncbi:hypothetical protein ACHAXS_011491 [Conticribra weissflogii]
MENRRDYCIARIVAPDHLSPLNSGLLHMTQLSCLKGFGKLWYLQNLELLGGIQIILRSEIPETVQELLEIVLSVYSPTLSGGMKRHLSVAMSTIGGASIVCFDKPTNGMDPVSLQFVWTNIDEIKPDWVVLLTTHAMGEANLLSDTGMIMCNGSLAACRSLFELKSQHGLALQFQKQSPLYKRSSGSSRAVGTG